MNKIEIEVPKDIRYISEWIDFDTDLLKGHSIINKTITGCGFTHYCLTNNIPTILCSPRKFLLENKFEQHDGIFLVINKTERSLNVDREDKVSRFQKELDNNFKDIQDLKNSLSSYLLDCIVFGKVPKILVTYDSLKYVLSTIGLVDLSNYSIIVDEFQNIFMDASFKAETELNFVGYLQDCPNVTYLSATPYIEEYLDELDEFKNLPYYELKWHPDRLRQIEITLKRSSNPNYEIDKIIESYKTNNFPTKYINGEFYQSKEVVFYVNSVRMIKNTIKRNNLTPDQVNIICADTTKNKKDIENLGHSIGKAPGRGKEHKMFTFCTRTTYVGADFYSTSAISIIVSDCAIDSLSTDIRMDFPQIMGRQRLKENVFRDECTFIYKLSDTDITVQDFLGLSKEKMKKSIADIQTFQYSKEIKSGDLEVDNLRVSNLLEDFRDRISQYRYKKDYTGIDEKTGQPTINKLVYLAEKRAFELRSDVYKNEVSVYNEFTDLSGIDISKESSDFIEDVLKNLHQTLLNPGSFETKMKAVCDVLTEFSGYVSISDIKGLKRNFKNYLLSLGIDKIRAKSYKEAELRKELDFLKSGDALRDTIISQFSLGSNYTLKEAKEMLKAIYLDLNLTKTPKATDLEEYFEVSSITIYEKHTKKRVKGYRILSIK